MSEKKPKPEPSLRSPFLEKAEQFYAVAKHFEESARKNMEFADVLNKTADAICEENIRRTQPMKVSP